MISATGNKLDRATARQGFSLIEVVLVVGLIALVAGMMVANIGVIAERSDSRSAEDLVRAAIRTARFDAAHSRTITALRFNKDLGQLQIRSESGTQHSIDLGEEFARRGPSTIRFYLVPASEGLTPPTDASRSQLETNTVYFAPDRSSSPFAIEIDYGSGSPERQIFDPFSSLTIADQ